MKPPMCEQTRVLSRSVEPHRRRRIDLSCWADTIFCTEKSTQEIVGWTDVPKPSMYASGFKC
jgi:hypothetical protein